MPNTSSAYDFEHFAPKTAESAGAPSRESRKKAQEQNVTQLTEAELRRSQRRGAHTVRTVLSLAAVLSVVLTIGAVVFGQVQLTELTEQIHEAEQALSEEKSLSVQLDMQANSNLNTDQIAAYARDQLGMEKITESQTTYISLSQGDSGTVLQENGGTGFFAAIWNAILSVFS